MSLTTDNLTGSEQPRPMETANRRLDWVDYAKGIGIILVVFAHNLGGQDHADIGIPPLLHGVIPYAYSFHMPLFFFLSGLFVMRSYRKGFAMFVKSKVATLLYPFVIWSFIQGMIGSAMQSYVNHPASMLRSIPYLLVSPVGDMWFLEALFIMAVVFAVMRRFGLPPLGFLLLGLAAAFAAPHISAALGYKILFNFLFFVLGIYFHDLMNKQLFAARPGWLLTVCLLALGLQLAAIFSPWLGGWGKVPRALITLLGITSAVSLSELLVRAESVRWLKVQWLKVIGQYTMPIYLMHTIFGSGIRIVLSRFLYLYDPWLHALLELAAGIVFPMLIAYVLASLNAVWVFEWPQRRPIKTVLHPSN